MRVHWHMRDMMRAPLPKPERAVASKAANLPYAELEASPVSPPNWAGLARALYIQVLQKTSYNDTSVSQTFFGGGRALEDFFKTRILLVGFGYNDREGPPGWAEHPLRSS